MGELLAKLSGARLLLAVVDPERARELAVGLAGSGGRVVPVPLDLGHVRQLTAHRHKFDRAVVDLERFAPDVRDGLLASVTEAVAPGGEILVLDGPGSSTRTVPARPLPDYPGHVVGAVADLFVGCGRVVELGCGRGHVLDAILMRDVGVVGIEADPDLADAARARGHEVHVGGLRTLIELREAGGHGPAVDGVFIGNAVEQATARVADVLIAARAVLPADGRCVLRAELGFLRDVVEPLASADAWHTVRLGGLPRDRRDGVLLLVAASGGGRFPAPATEDLVLATAELPVNAPLLSWFDLERFERRMTSQCGEDGVIAAIFERIGETNRNYVEFGCGDGVQCNTRQLQLAGWTGLLMDGGESPGEPDITIHHEWITRDNINELFDRHSVPAEPDLMSIDLDGNDYWVFAAIERRPRVLIVEYNGNVADDRALTIPYDPAHRWDGTDYYGASLLAIERLARRKGYTLVHCTTAGVNAIFVRSDLLGNVAPLDPAVLHRPANYWYRRGRSLPDISRAMLDLDQLPPETRGADTTSP
ncbi:MAG: class I SAM-dependent methyltransferase [bacterium]|nr:class I SAM-dependent methyltransferase [bacterium]